MTQNSINVTASTGAPIKVNVAASSSQGAVTLSQDTSAYNAEIARQWAISDKMVLQEDYSSKYYANKAKDSENSAKNYANVAETAYNNIQDSANGVIADIETARVDAVDNITTVKSESIASVETKATEASEEIETKTTEAIGNLEEIVETSIAEYTEIANQIKQDNSESSELAKDWAISEVIVDNLDYSAKYWAGKAKDNSGIFYDELADEDIDVEIISGGYVTKADLELGLDTKQDKGDYALKEEIPSLDGYVKDTDYATTTTSGVVKLGSTTFGVTQYNGYLQGYTVNLENYNKAGKPFIVCKGTLENIKDDYVKRGITENQTELTADEKANAKAWLGYAEPTDIMQAIASIPQFKLSIVDELPLAGEKMTLYLVPKEGTNNDVYDEYIWIEQTTSFEHLGTTAVDLTDYVKNTDYATGDIGGVVKISGNYFGLAFNGSKQLYVNKAMDTEVTAKASHYKPIVPSNLDLAVKTGVTTNTIELTDDEKTSARTWLGAIGNADYAQGAVGGVVKTSTYYGVATNAQGFLLAAQRTLDSYNKGDAASFISKGTLDNVLTQYSKTVLTTEADYNALETKDANTLYLIEE
jgi:hypothetical protein